MAASSGSETFGTSADTLVMIVSDRPTVPPAGAHDHARMAGEQRRAPLKKWIEFRKPVRRQSDLCRRRRTERRDEE
ncbi:MAG: hypothetical protein AUJ01_03110 [Acidobacteria bacterium 13_1_40CM_3_65_5]|nr:MAG: hypothetical protein AUJ01_03110 [Acidobacteria bacterium 13_1_40CM_3_65_5]